MLHVVCFKTYVDTALSFLRKFAKKALWLGPNEHSCDGPASIAIDSCLRLASGLKVCGVVEKGRRKCVYTVQDEGGRVIRDGAVTCRKRRVGEAERQQRFST